MPNEPESSHSLLARSLAPKLRALAEQGVYFGTSSWKYEGWLGSIYSPDRYETRGKFSKKKFEETCLAEYAEVFPTVCGDFAFYQFPSEDYWARLFGESPSSLIVGLKVPEDITVAAWPKHARYGTKAGKPNVHFLNAEVFTTLFVRRLAPYSARVGPLILEFGTFNKSTFPTVDDFLEKFDGFLSKLPKGPRYSVEIRNPEYLGPAYFALLASHNVAHVFTAWTRMPELAKQIAMEGAHTADFTVARAIVAKGQSYERSVEAFEPYDRIQELNHPAREAMAELCRQSIARNAPAFLYVNNRLEGYAPGTIAAVADWLDIDPTTLAVIRTSLEQCRAEGMDEDEARRKVVRDLISALPPEATNDPTFERIAARWQRAITGMDH
ncbi:DUF72 domain-containing protein [Singulisphaera rosea]